MVLSTFSVKRRLCLLSLLFWLTDGLSQNSTSASYLRSQPQAATPASFGPKVEDEYFRRLQVDELVLRRFKSVPEGYRKHPSYYSETYLPRAKSYNPSAKADLTEEWGSWTFVDPKQSTRPNNDFYDKYPNRDVPFTDFPDTSWQKDKDYLAKFLPEAISLLERAMEAILSEYGLGKKDMPGTSFEERSKLFQLVISDKQEATSIAGWMNPSSYAGFKRRLLHAVMTEDRFTFAMGGHSAAAGHGNHMQQSYTLQITRIVEPVLARLGVKATARNFGAGGMGTVQSAMASADIYGKDVDVLMWDSSMTEGGAENRGIFAVQALLSMDRAPLLWFQRLDGVYDKLSAFADIAAYGTGYWGIFKEVETVEEFNKLPYARKFFQCPKDLKTSAECVRWDGICWVNRTDFVWEGMDLSYTPKNRQDAAPGGRAGWHPGNREHQLTGRGFTFPVFQALHDQLKMWNEAPDYVLKDEVWHVTEHYNTIKTKLLETEEQKQLYEGWCESRKVPKKFCTHAAHARTEFTPRANPWSHSLRAIMAGSEYPTTFPQKNDYDPPEMYNPTLDPPEGAVDVLAIVENGVAFSKNLARVKDSARDMMGPIFTTDGKGSKHNPDIKGGKGWNLSDDGVVGTDSCDGEYDNWCQRGFPNPCLMIAHNDGRHGIVFDGTSGWMIYNVPKVQQGLIVAKFHTWMFFPTKATSGWCSENNAEPCQSRNLMTETIPKERLLKPAVPNYCDAFKFEFAIDGKITSWSLSEFLERRKEADRVVELVTLLDEETWEGARDVEVAMRITGCGRQKIFSLTHLYWI